MHSLLIIVPEGAMIFEAAGIADILQHANQRLESVGREDLYQITIATTQSHRVALGRSGLRLLADHRLFDLDPTKAWDTIVVAGKGSCDEENSRVADWARIAAANSCRIVSICGAALLLAEAGLLDGRRATTHWRRIDELQRRFPKVKAEKGPIYVHDGPAWSSAGATAGFDLTLALVEQDCGFAVARDVAQDLVMFLRRPGGQSQFSRNFNPDLAKAGPIRDLQTWIRHNLNEDISVEKLAEKVAMSPRNFTRVFTRETGCSPAKYVEESRLESAREQLEQSSKPVNAIAIDSGFTSALKMRRVFERHLHITPSEYRHRFHASEHSNSALSHIDP